jgi:hypothetical protein
MEFGASVFLGYRNGDHNDIRRVAHHSASGSQIWLDHVDRKVCVVTSVPDRRLTMMSAHIDPRAVEPAPP